MRDILSSVVVALAFAPAWSMSVDIDVGRQLFVDDRVIESTSLRRVWHKPVKHPANPVLRPETEVEMNRDGSNATRPIGGVWWNAAKGVFECWYEGGFCHAMCYATSADGIRWERPDLRFRPGTNVIMPSDNPALHPDTWTVVKDPNPRRPGERFKMLSHRPWSVPVPGAPAPNGFCAVSPDGLDWKVVYPLPPCGDRTTLHYNPFGDEWVYSLRSAHYCGTERHRDRKRYAQFDFTRVPEGWTHANGTYSPKDWMRDLEPGGKSQLYSFDAVAYESVMWGLFMMHDGPDNKVCDEAGLPKITRIVFGFSRDGVNYERPCGDAMIAPEGWESDAWDRGYVCPLPNGCVIVGDELRLYYGAAAGNPGRSNYRHRSYDNGATGIATMRRDGFVSLDGTGELLTRPLAFSGSALFVNANAAEGLVAAELVDEAGAVVPGYSADESRMEKFDSTKRRVVWRDRESLPFSSRGAFRLRFRLENAALYAFWVSMSEDGASNGYLAGGGPGYEGLVDVPKRRPAIAPSLLPPADAVNACRSRASRPSVAVAPSGRIWATWEAGDCVVLATSPDGGKWEVRLVADPDGEGPRTAFSPQLWMAPDGLLRWTWTDRVGGVDAWPGDDQLWIAAIDAESGRAAESPRVVARGVMGGKPSVLRDGTWMLPVAEWGGSPSACCWASTDGGRTFVRRGGVFVPKALRSHDDHSIFERRDGSLFCLLRVAGGNGANALWESVSTDGGFQWSEPRPAAVANLSSRTPALRLADGRWALVKHTGYAVVPDKPGILCAHVSDDDGVTWWGGLKVEPGDGAENPDIAQCPDGSVVMVAERGGGVSFARFTADQAVRCMPFPKVARIWPAGGEAGDGKVSSVSVAAFVKEGAPDDTEALQAAIDSGAREVVVPKRDRSWTTKPLVGRSNLTLTLEQGAVIDAVAGAFVPLNDSMLTFDRCTNVTIRGRGAVLRMRKWDYLKPPYKHSEWRHCISLKSCVNVLIEGVTIRESGGDGIYLGASGADLVNRHVVIRDVTCDGNNRQGISVISANDLLIENCDLRNTYGASPEAGIDFEPNNPREELVNIRMRNCRMFNNAGSGLEFWLTKFNDTTRPVDILVEGCETSGNNEEIRFRDSGKGGYRPNPRGVVTIRRSKFRNSRTDFIHVAHQTDRSVDLRIEACDFLDDRYERRFQASSPVQVFDDAPGAMRDVPAMTMERHAGWVVAVDRPRTVTVRAVLGAVQPPEKDRKGRKRKGPEVLQSVAVRDCSGNVVAEVPLSAEAGQVEWRFALPASGVYSFGGYFNRNVAVVASDAPIAIDVTSRGYRFFQSEGDLFVYVPQGSRMLSVTANANSRQERMNLTIRDPDGVLRGARTWIESTEVYTFDAPKPGLWSLELRKPSHGEFVDGGLDVHGALGYLFLDRGRRFGF